MKNYVKEYKGYKVPEGATHYIKSVDLLFYRKNIRKDWVYFSDTLNNWTYANISEVSLNNKTIELPEAPQEWNGEGLPPVGVECEIAKVRDAPSWNKGVVDFYGREKCIVTFYDGREAAFILNRVLFRPIKTQQEKDREAFVTEAIKYGGAGMCFIEFSHNLFIAGARFTAPKDGDNDK